MVTSVSAAGTAPARITSVTKEANSTTSFADKLAGVLQEFLYKSGEDSHLQFDIQAVKGQDSGTRQFVVTVTDSSGRTTTSSSSTASSSSSTTNARTSAPTPKPEAPKLAEPVYTLMGIPRPPASATSPPAIAEALAPGVRLASGKLVTNESEAYWATQPPAVQQLMNINSDFERGAKALELADQGYLIDVPIMVWNWDPLSTMTVRKNQGFTWVPSAKMAPVAVAPGLEFPGLPNYDPKNPPPGAITVSTDWAKGFEHTSPWMRFEQAT